MTDEDRSLAMMWLEYAVDAETCLKATGHTPAMCSYIAHQLIQAAPGTHYEWARGESTRHVEAVSESVDDDSLDMSKVATLPLDFIPADRVLH